MSRNSHKISELLSFGIFKKLIRIFFTFKQIDVKKFWFVFLNLSEIVSELVLQAIFEISIWDFWDQFDILERF
jgi:hypothetical protein